MSYKILVAGQGRAGSSVLWEIMHEILLGNGIKAERSFSVEQAKEAESHVMKFHPYRKDMHDWADFVITPRRDMRESVDSYERVLPNRVTDLASLKRVCEEVVTLHSAWEEHSDHEMVYERFRHDPAKVILELASVIGMECDPEAILDKVGRPPKKKPFKIPPDFIRFIEEEFGWWLEKYGYL